MRAVDLFTNIVGEVEDGRGTSWTQHAAVHRLNHPPYFLTKGQILRRRKGQVGGIKSSWCGARIVGVKSGHVVVRIGLDEDAPSRGRGCAAVGPRERRGAVRLKGVGT